MLKVIFSDSKSSNDESISLYNKKRYLFISGTIWAPTSPPKKTEQMLIVSLQHKVNKNLIMHAQ